MHSTDLKTTLIKEIKQDEWKKSIDKDEYVKTTKLLTTIHQRNLEEISTANRNFKCVTGKIRKRPIKPKVNSSARKAYENWKKENFIVRRCPEVSLKKMLLLIHYLNLKDTVSEEKCFKRQNSEEELFWDSPTFILNLMRKCVLRRDWNNLTFCSLILLDHDKKYLHVVRKMCSVMIKLNPVVKENGLEQQFEQLTEQTGGDIVTI